MSLELAAIADDLTGAVELASLLVRAGAPTRVLTERALASDAAGVSAIVFGLKIRTVPARQALSAVQRAVLRTRDLKPRRYFYKYCATFDSTPRGNIGPVSDLLRAETGSDFVGFCPAFPEVDRTVYRGHLFVGDLLVSRSPKRLDPVTPMREPDLVQVLQAQTRLQVGLLRASDIRDGLSAVAARVEELRRQGAVYAIFDTICEEDLVTLAQATVDWRLMTGGSSIAAYYPALWAERGELPGPLPSPPALAGPGVVLAGSCAARTEEQLACFERGRPVLRLDVGRLAEDDTIVGEAVAWALAHLGNGPVAIATTEPPEQVAALQAAHGRRRLADRIEKTLGRIASGLHAAGVRRFVVAGGETSGAIVDSLGVGALEVGPYEAPGMAKAWTTGSDPLFLQLKSGKLGPVDMFEKVLAS